MIFKLSIHFKRYVKILIIAYKYLNNRLGNSQMKMNIESTQDSSI